VAPAGTIPAGLANGRTLGQSNAPVTLVIWSDFQCPSCAALAREVQPKLVAEFVVPGTLRITYRDDAFIGQESIDAAVAARCAGDQNRFWPYHDYLFWNQQHENSGTFNRAFFDAVADAVGLDRPAFDTCLGTAAGAAAVAADTAAADAAGVQLTPSLQIGVTMMPGAPISDAQYDVLRKVIERTVSGQ
jgi:protein-disulfide isomerase